VTTPFAGLAGAIFTAFVGAVVLLFLLPGSAIHAPGLSGRRGALAAAGDRNADCTLGGGAATPLRGFRSAPDPEALFSG
jgi:hypothetical protein